MGGLHIGAQFSFEGERYEVKASPACDDCAFSVEETRGKCNRSGSVAGHCSGTVRTDQTSVIFVKVS